MSPQDQVVAAPDRAAARLTGGINGWSTAAAPELGIESVTVVDGPLGLVSRTMDERDSSLLLPSGTALAATWDTGIVHDVGLVLGRQAAERQVDVMLAPNVNMPRTPLSGRAFEMWSEDPWLTGFLATAWAAGVREQGVGICAKHLVCNDTETQRTRMNATIGPVPLREVYLRPFEMLIEAGIEMVLAAYNRVNGVPCAEQAELFEILKGEWGFDGVIVSDWFGVVDGLASARAGLDLEMPGPARHMGERLVEYVTSGELSAERLTDMVTRMTELAARTGRAGEPLEPAPGSVPVDATAILHRAAAASYTLLTNEGAVLPLNPAELRRVAVIGHNAQQLCLQGGTFARVNPIGPVISPLAALRDALPDDVEIVHSPGVAAPAPATFAELGSRTPDGSAGVLLETFSGATPAVVAHTDVRASSSFVWFGPVPGIGTDPAGRVRLTAVVTPTVTGDWTFGVGGTGDATLSVDGHEVTRSTAPPPDDVMGVVARAEVTTGTVHLVAGTPVTVVAESLVGGARVRAITATAMPPVVPGLLDDAVDAATGADVVILVVGDHQGASRESEDRTTMALSADQVDLIERVTAANPRTVVVVNASRAVHMPWADRAAAVLMTWFAGEQSGPALASVLLGTDEPRGRLPLTFPMRDEDIPGWGTGLGDDFVLDYDATEPTGYRHGQRHGLAPRYPLGHGLGYTTFELVRAQVTGEVVTAEVRNTGERHGRDVIQVYTRAPGEPDHRLAGFAAVELDAGETRTVTVDLDQHAFRRWSTELNRWVVPAGVHDLLVGRSCIDLPVELKIRR